MRTGFWLLVLAALLNVGCTLSPEEKGGREQSLKTSADSFVADVIQPNWVEAYRLTDGSFPNEDALKAQLTQSWVGDSTLTAGTISSMAWVNDTTAKVKVDWVFQAGSAQTLTSETFIWVWKGEWKLRGRVIR